MRLTGKVAIVTGGSSGMGRATAVLFGKEGAKVAIGSDRNVVGGEEVARLIRDDGGEAIYVQTDVSKAADCARLVRATVEAFGRLDVLFNNAGFSDYGPIEQYPEENWDRIMAVNAKGAFLMSREAVPHMKQAGGGSIIMTSSVHAIRTSPTAAAYAASKAALLGMTRAMAFELGKFRIRVNAIAPGSIDLFVYPNPAHLASGRTKDGRWAIAPREPMGRMGTPDEVAYAVLFLASDESQYISGVTLALDGALLAALRLEQAPARPEQHRGTEAKG